MNETKECRNIIVFSVNRGVLFIYLWNIWRHCRYLRLYSRGGQIDYLLEPYIRRQPMQLLCVYSLSVMYGNNIAYCVRGQQLEQHQWPAWTMLWSPLLYMVACHNNGECGLEGTGKDLVMTQPRQYPGIFQEWLKITTQPSVGVNGAMAEVQTEHFQVHVTRVTASLYCRVMSGGFYLNYFFSNSPFCFPTRQLLDCLIVLLFMHCLFGSLFV
jgi:hypothetical protein